MEVKKNIFANLPKAQYLELLPNLKSERAQEVTTLVLTFFAITLFGFFAINPTLSIIANLKRQLADNKFVNQKLEEKIASLRILQDRYALLQNDVPIVLSAIPQNAMAPFFLGQVQALSQNTKVNLTRLQASQVELTHVSQVAQDEKNNYASFPFTMEANGTYPNVANFIVALASFDRIASIDTLVVKKSIEPSKPTYITISGYAYFKQ